MRIWNDIFSNCARSSNSPTTNNIFIFVSNVDLAVLCMFSRLWSEIHSLYFEKRPASYLTAQVCLSTSLNYNFINYCLDLPVSKSAKVSHWRHHTSTLHRNEEPWEIGALQRSPIPLLLYQCIIRYAWYAEGRCYLRVKPDPCKRGLSRQCWTLQLFHWR